MSSSGSEEHCKPLPWPHCLQHAPLVATHVPSCLPPAAAAPLDRWHQPAYWQQRFFTCDEFYQPGGPIFFYLGNEADVTLYLNNTGVSCGAPAPWLPVHPTALRCNTNMQQDCGWGCMRHRN